MLKVVCKIGKFTIRDAILFHKFCIFNKEYFVFLAHRMFGCKSFFGVCLCFFTGLILVILYLEWVFMFTFRVFCFYWVPSW